jgi:hypothetical protein
MSEQKYIKDLFGWLKEITLYKSDIMDITEDSWKSFQPFMINRYLSMNPDYIEIVNYIQKFSNSPKPQFYTMYKNIIPKKQVYLKWIGGKKQSQNTELVEKLSKYFVISKREIVDYLEILKKKDIKEILESMGEDEKDIKKLLK